MATSGHRLEERDRMPRDKLVCSVAIGLAVTFFGLATISPDAWYQPAQLNPELRTPRFNSAVGLRVCFFIDALLALAVARWGLRTGPTRAPTENVADVAAFAGDLSDRAAMRFLIAICVLAVILRIIGLDHGLWLDEISPVVDYGHLSAIEVIATYLGSANHLLNTLLVNGSMALFGREEWAIRLPAALFGMLTIPAIYYVARIALSRRASLIAAALLATAYHHVFFSQNARGYAGYLLFSLLSSGLVAKALARNLRRDWVAYVVAALLSVASLLNAVFVIVAHAIIALTQAWSEWRIRSSPSLIRSVSVSFALVGYLTLHLYSLVIPQILSVMNTTYKMQSAGFSSPFSVEFLSDLISGLSPAIAFGAAGIGIAVALVGLIGLWRLWRGSKVLTASLILPNMLLVIFVVVEQVNVTPRIFLFALIVAVICGAAGIESILDRLVRGLGPSALNYTVAITTGLAVIVSIIGLKNYYQTPKQDYLSAVNYIVANRRPTDVVIIVYLAKYGYAYYATDLDPLTFFVRDQNKFDQILKRSVGRRIWAITTFERALRIDFPAIDRELQKGDWIVARRIPATIGDGNILIYRSDLR